MAQLVYMVITVTTWYYPNASETTQKANTTRSLEAVQALAGLLTKP